MDRAQRLNEAFRYLRSCGKIHTQKDLAIAMGATPPNVSSALKGVDKVLTENFIRRFVGAFDGIISYDWLLTGDGEMLKPKEQKTDEKAEMIGRAFRASTLEEGVANVRFFAVTPTATFQEFCDGESEEPDYIPVVAPANEYIDESSCVFEIHGESMLPSIPDKARVLCREIPPTKWHLISEGVIVIAYHDRFVIKRVIDNQLGDKDYLIIASDNPDYTGQETVYRADIRCIFQARHVLSYPIR